MTAKADISLEDLFLGFDLSTQGLKATAVTPEFAVAYEASVNFDLDLPAYGTEGGAHRHADGITVTSPPLMWVEALDLVLSRMQSDRFDFSRVKSISGSGQQHGSVWLGKSASGALNALDSAQSLHSQLHSIFSVEASPIWMDSSTREECDALESALGGAQAVADLTGSRAYERFTGNQIARIARLQSGAYAETDRISLVSSFMASLLIGDIAPIDASDAAGMNLMNFREKEWDAGALEATAPDLRAKLGRVVASHAAVGTIHPGYVQRFGFDPRCLVVAFSGDNPNSLAGLRLQRPGDVAISLGTSDTLFGSLTHAVPSGCEGHIFPNPIAPDAYMAMIVRQNGSLARERVRDDVAGGEWKTFEALVESLPPGNDGFQGLYYFEPEITPPVVSPGIFRFDVSGNPTDAFSPAQEARAILESQFLSLRLHAERVGLRPENLVVTGGASVNPVILQTLASVFGQDLYAAEKSDSASLGAAYRAMHGFQCHASHGFVPFSETMASAPRYRKVASPDPSAVDLYTQRLVVLDRLEKSIPNA